MKISVAVITYNQEKTIQQTIDSILSQKGDFELEIVIGDDHSRDETRNICLDYVSRFSVGNQRIVRLLPDEPNLGILRNFERVINECNGDYVAICAGDDYWCDDYKIQKQLNYFHEHEDCGVVSSAGYKYLVKRKKLVPNAIAPFHPISDGIVKRYYFSSNYCGGVYAMPLSLLIKKGILNYVDFKEFIKRGFPVEDYPMQAVMSQYCKWGHIPESMVVYRVYKESATFISFDNPNYISYHRGLMNIRRYLNEIFPSDACVSEESMIEYEFYKEFLLYLHQFKYNKAKLLISENAQILQDSLKYKKAYKITKTRILFSVFAIYKELTYWFEIKNRT